MSFLENIVDWLNEQPLMNKLAILVVLVLIISGLYWYFIWSPNNDQLKGFQKTLQTKRKKLNELENIKADLPKFIAENKRLNKEFEIASLKLPKEEEIPALINSIYSDISAAGLEPKKFAPQGQVNKEIYAEIPIEMNVRGSYFELANFFDRISRLPRIVNVRNLNLKRDKTSSRGNIELDAEFTTVTFRLLPPPPEDKKLKGKKNSKKTK
ncbi:MAG: type 4a pilus biogenesis protein PilO [Thermodesulfobacteriota bacterium]